MVIVMAFIRMPINSLVRQLKLDPVNLFGDCFYKIFSIIVLINKIFFQYWLFNLNIFIVYKVLKSIISFSIVDFVDDFFNFFNKKSSKLLVKSVKKIHYYEKISNVYFINLIFKIVYISKYQKNITS